MGELADLVLKQGFSVAVAIALLYFFLKDVREGLKEQNTQLKHLSDAQDTTNIILAKMAASQGIQNPGEDRREHGRAETES